MTSSKRDFTKFDEFPGEVDETGCYIMPTLWHSDDAERLRMWTIYVRLIKTSSKANFTGIDWDKSVETQVNISPSYLKMGTSIANTIQAEAWVETGISDGKITRSSPTYFDQPKNEGRSNERNVFQQALIYARAQWIKRKEKGSSEEQNSQSGQSSQNQSVMYFPMLAKAFKDGEKHLEFPLYVQPKLDGIRCLAYLSKPDNVIIYTRTKKLFPSVDYLKKILYPYLKALYDDENKQSIYLDGELYKHGKKLQDISGDSRNENANVLDSNQDRNEYHIYDCFYPQELNTTFKSRYEQLTNLYDSISDDDAKVLKQVPTILVKNIDAAYKKYDQFTKMGYEGAILRNVDGPYLASADKTGAFLRSNDLVKMKPKFTDEFKVIDFTEGTRGKDKGAIIWICTTKKGVNFNVTPKDITYEDRYELFKEATKSFNKKYANKMLTVEYEDLSKNGVPLRAKAVVFRDYE